MSIMVETPNPKKLLEAIYGAIDKKDGKKGGVETWTYNHEGFFTYGTGSGEWEKAAWLKPDDSKEGVLTFEYEVTAKGLLKPNCYGVYHGRFIEMLLNHFASQLSLASATSEGKRPVKLGVRIPKNRA